MYATVRFEELAVGEQFWLTNEQATELYGPYTKIEARECPVSQKFYESQGTKFYGWNAIRPYWNGEKIADGEWGLKPETPCVRESDRATA